jgi:site-specific recombinase XerD
MKSLIEQPQLADGFTVDYAVSSWLEDKEKHTGSQKTAIAYRDALLDFRGVLQQQGYDLLVTPALVTELAKMWAAMRSKESRRKGEVSANTYNQRLYILSSFYSYLQGTFGWDGENPIKRIKKRPVQAYAGAMSLDDSMIVDALAQIDTTKLQGKRNMALLLLALTTGRRATELLSMRIGNITKSKGSLLVVFPHTKEDKTMRDTLDETVMDALVDYLRTFYGEDWIGQKEKPVWISLERERVGEPLTMRGFNYVLFRLLGTTKIHALRHTFAVDMDKSGASLAVIASRLGHASTVTTNEYLKQLRSDENPFAKGLVARFLPGGRK